MATAAERTGIIGLVVGMVGAAPGATILAELEAIFDSGVSLAEMADAIAANPTYSGDTGLYPAFLPNAIWSKNFVTDLIGAEVTEANLALAIEAITGLLNAGESRGAVAYAAVIAVAGLDQTDPDFGNAAKALNNKIAVAEYYSVTLGESSNDLAVLRSIVSGVTSDDDAIEDGEAAADDIVAAAQPLLKLITDLDAANDAVAAFLVTADNDSDPETSATENDVNVTAPANAQTDLAGVLDDYFNDVIGDNPGNIQDITSGAAYTAASDGVKAALIADQLEANDDAGEILDDALTDAADDVDDVAGLTAAVAVYVAALEAQAEAASAAVVTGGNLDAAIIAYGEADEAVTNVGAAGLSFTTVSDGQIIGLNADADLIVIKPGFTEATNPGITALYTAALTNFAAVYGTLDSANAAVASANEIVQNLDYVDGNAKELAMDAMAAAMVLRDVVVPALDDRPSVVEYKLEQDGLQDAQEVLEDALEDISAATTAADDDVAFLAALADALDDAEAAGTITNAQNVAALAAAGDTAGADEFDTQGEVDAAIVLVKAELNQAGGSLSFDFDVLVDNYEITITPAPDAESPDSFAYLAALDAVATHAEEDADFAFAIAARDDSVAAVAALKVLTDARTDAEDAFGDAGYGIPVTLGAVASGTSADDVFIANGVSSQILGFADDDQLFIGSDLSLNAATTAGGSGDNAVLEYWVTGTSNATITVETSVFGSSAATPETFTIVLTGVAAADVSISADGILTLA